MFLYHATDRKNLDSILSNGLLINPPEHNWKDMYCEGKIFLAFSALVAEEYTKSIDNPPNDIVILKIKLDSLKSTSFGYDWNNRCEYTKDINSCVYKANIPADIIQICNSSDEPEQTIFDFKYTDLYDIILNVFDEEIETNLERED